MRATRNAVPILFAALPLFLFLLFFTATDLKAGGSHPFIGLKVNPLGGMASALPIHIEVFAGERHSVVAGVGVIRSRSGSGSSFYSSDGFTITPEFRHYFSVAHEMKSRTYGGLWLGYEEHGNTTIDRNGEHVAARVYGRGGGLLFGNQWFFDNGFLVDVYFGPGYVHYSTSENYDLNVSKGGFLVSLTGPKQTGTKVRLGFTVGLAF